MTPFTKHRLSAGLTKRALAKLLGVTHQTVSQWENGVCRPNARHYPKLAEVFHLAPMDVVNLFDGIARKPADAA